MKRRVKFVSGGVLLAAVAIQFVPVERENPPVSLEVPAPAQVLEVLRQACYDCHSNRTNWPWYAWIAPVSWMIAGDVEEAREELNFTEWDQMSPSRVEKKMAEIWEEVEEGEMPLAAYRFLHASARLTPAQKEILRSWTGGGKE